MTKQIEKDFDEMETIFDTFHKGVFGGMRPENRGEWKDAENQEKDFHRLLKKYNKIKKKLPDKYKEKLEALNEDGSIVSVEALEE